MSRARRMWIALAVVAGVIVIGIAGFLIWTRFGAGSDAPRIGISISTDWYDQMRIQPAPYSMAVARAGANVRMFEVDDLPELDRILDGIHGLILVGGGDVAPELSGGDPESASRVDRSRDDFEIELLRRAEKRGLPVLAICRGSQLLAVAHGGTLKSLRDDEELAERHGVTLKSLSAHDVNILPGSRLHEAMGEGPYKVSSTHFQAIADPGPRLTVAARAPDGVIEAVELPGDRLVMGIQWHPELESMSEEVQMIPFRMLVEAARSRAKR